MQLADVVEYFLGPVRSPGLPDPYVDPRTRDWAVVNPVFGFGMTFAYIFGVPLGIYLMKDRPAINVRGFANAHNLFLVVLSAYMCWETLYWANIDFGWSRTGFLRNFKLYGESVDPLVPHVGGRFPEHFSEAGFRLACVLNIHTLSKVYEYLDTVIMIMHKKFNQITVLHYYHHWVTFFLWWLQMRYAPGGDAHWPSSINSLVHVIMYSYYFLTSLGIRPPFKQIITVGQIVQFCFLIMQGVMLIISHVRPRIVFYTIVVHATVLLVLFLDFYIRAYIKGARKAKEGRAANGRQPAGPTGEPAKEAKKTK